MTGARAGLVGLGQAVPPTVRTNDDPVFDWLHQHHPPGEDLFEGYVTRRVLAPGEALVDLMEQAARQALAASRVPAAEIDQLVGYASAGEYLTPNTLALLHQRLGLAPRAAVVPIGGEFSTFNYSLVLADGVIRAGRARHVLIAVGGDWTRLVDYHTPQAISAGDGAGAAVLAETSDAAAFSVVDVEVEVAARYYGSMYLAGDPVPDQPSLFTAPTFHITPAGQEGFKQFGITAPPAVANRLLARNRLSGSDIALISHQASAVLIDRWAAAITPRQYLHTLPELANMTVANVPVNLARFAGRFATDHVVLLSVGAEMHASAVLLRRAG